jgi:hypothetical protein
MTAEVDEEECGQQCQEPQTDTVPVPVPSIGEVKEVIISLKNNRAQGIDNISAEVIKHGGEQLTLLIHQLIIEIWESEQMSKEWSLAIICQINKKKDVANCENYRGISLLSEVHKVLAKILARRQSCGGTDS